MNHATPSTELVNMLRTIGAAHITLGQHYHQVAEQYESNRAIATGAITAAVATVAMAPVAPPAAAPLAAPPAFPQAAAPAAPGTVAPVASAALGDDGKPKRIRRTKAQIEADEAAIKLGYTSHADMVAKTGQSGAPAMPAAPMAAPGAPVSAVQHVQQPGLPPAPPAAAPAPVAPPPPAAPAAPAFTGPSVEDLTASLQNMIQTVETAGWVGHGEGQAATLLGKLGYQTVHTVPAEQRQGVIDWVNHFKTEFMAGRLPVGAATAGFIS